jgi:hypothetical protein
MEISEQVLNSLDTPSNSSFLNSSILEDLQIIFENSKKEILTAKNKKQSLRILQKYFSFIKVFTNQGVRGIAGLLEINKTINDKYKNLPIVFKISTGFNKDVEHEHLVTSHLNKLRTFCPHLIGSLGMIKLPISGDFIEKPQSSHLFANSSEVYPCNVLFIEYVSPMSLYHLCKYRNEDVSLIISILCMILITFAIGQMYTRLCHYDSHVDNILIRTIDPNSFFLYKIKDEYFILPTFGFYPVLIDFGSSYSNACENNPMYTSSANYHNGLQSTLYDGLNDVQHLLTSVFFYLEEKKQIYTWLRQKFMMYFRHVPILSVRGWKQLPFNILEEVVNKMTGSNKELEKIKVWKKLDVHIVEILNALIILPWDSKDELNFNDETLVLVEQLQILFNVLKTDKNNNEESEFNILWILRETVDLINQHRKEIVEKTSQNWIELWKENIFSKPWPDNFNLEKLVNCLLKVSEIISSNYYTLVQEHVEIINKNYIKSELKGPLNATKFLLRNTPINFEINKDSVIYLWNIDDQYKKVTKCDFNDEILKQMNQRNNSKRAQYIYELVLSKTK